MFVARLWFVVLAAALLWSVGAGAMCLPGASGRCVNFDALPQISEQVVGTEGSLPTAKKAVNTGSGLPYTGPTLGVAPNVRRAPTVGYKWVFD